MLGGVFQLSTFDATCRTSCVNVEIGKVLIQLVTVGNEAVEVIVICLPLVDQKFGQCSCQERLAAGTVLQKAFSLFDQPGLALVGDDQAGVIFTCSQLHLPVERRGFGAQVCTEDQNGF